MVPACAGFAGVNAGRDCQAHRVGGASRCVFCDRAMRAVQYVSPRPAPKLSRRKRSSPPPIPNIKFPQVY